MSQLRFDQTTNDWVVFAPSRALRPHTLHNGARAKMPVPDQAVCAFCPGNEALTPPEIYAVRTGNDANSWQVRVIPNKFPALRIEDDARRQSEGNGFRFMGGCGAHEVVIESRDHNALLAQQPIEHVERVLVTLQQRYRDLLRDSRFQAIIVFKNHGVSAGTSLPHPHWQIIATPVVPRLLRTMHFEAIQFFDREGKNLYSTMLEAELTANQRILATNDAFVALMPYASHVPFETWIIPRQEKASFGQVTQDQMRLLAGMLKTVLLKLHTGLDNPNFNLTIDSAPRGEEEEGYFLWHMRILPRLATPAGFELGSGMSINTVFPEDARNFLSEVPVV